MTDTGISQLEDDMFISSDNEQQPQDQKLKKIYFQDQSASQSTNEEK